MMTRFRTPAVDSTSPQLIFAPFNSSSSVSSIWEYSALTNSESPSPSAWYFTSMAYASSPLRFDISQRGDSGRNQMKDTWSRLGIIWRNDGILHPQLLGMENVLSVTPAALMEPKSNQSDSPSK